MTRLYIVRHGNTFEAGESPRRIGARTDLPLAAAGLAQAEALGAHFAQRGIRFARALSSGLKRTDATAEAILRQQPHPLVLETADFLAEIDHGPDENQPEDAVLARIGRAALDLWDTETLPPPGWDARAEWRQARWLQFAAEAVAGHRDDAILLVTSNGAGRFALLAFGLRPGGKTGSVKFRTGSYGLVEAGGGGKFRLLEWDRRPDPPTGQ
jgi:probable phosphoglycerate mutase